MKKQGGFVDKVFYRYYLIIYYLYMMGVDILFPKQGIAAVLINIPVMLFLLYATFTRNKHSKKFVLVYAYLIFIFVLILLQSSNLMYSMRNFIKYSYGLLCLPLGFNILSSPKRLREFQKTGLILICLYIINWLLNTIFELGYTIYSEDSAMRYGNVFSDGLFVNVYLVVSVFLLLYFFPAKRKLILILLAVVTLLVIANMKRTPIIVLVIGLVVYLLVYYYNVGTHSKFGKKQIKYILLFLLLFVSILPFFRDDIKLMYSAREEKFEKASEDITYEGRISESIEIWNEIIYADNIVTTLIGKETFNYVGTYAGGKYGGRQIHNDYAIILHGTGVLGLSLFLTLCFYLIVWMVRMRRTISRHPDVLSSIIYSLFFAFITIYMFAMISGLSSLVISSSLFYASVGGFLRHFYNTQRLIKKCSKLNKIKP